MKIRFLSGNPLKIKEATSILAAAKVEVIPVDLSLIELQTDDTVALVREKTLKAFHKLGQKVFVEQTGLSFKKLNGFPGGLTQVFWDTLEAERVCDLFGAGPDNQVTAKTIVGYCDGKRVRTFKGEVQGRISSMPRGDRSFQWDCVFIPDGYSETFAELGETKNEISMRRRALDAFAKFLKANYEP